MSRKWPSDYRMVRFLDGYCTYTQLCAIKKSLSVSMVNGRGVCCVLVRSCLTCSHTQASVPLATSMNWLLNLFKVQQFCANCSWDTYSVSPAASPICGSHPSAPLSSSRARVMASWRLEKNNVRYTQPVLNPINKKIRSDFFKSENFKLTNLFKNGKKNYHSVVFGSVSKMSENDFHNCFKWTWLEI